MVRVIVRILLATVAGAFLVLVALMSCSALVHARETVRGLDSKKMAYVQTRFAKGPLREFTVKFRHPDTLVDR